MRVTTPALRLSHFMFIRAAIEGVALGPAWSRYMAGEATRVDPRHAEVELRALCRQIESAALGRGLALEASTALADLASRSGRSVPALHASPRGFASVGTPEWADHDRGSEKDTRPDLKAWIAEECLAQRIDSDFQSQADWLADYLEAFGAAGQGAAVPRPALALPLTVNDHRAPAAPSVSTGIVTTLADRLAALKTLSDALAQPPALSDRLSAWLSAELAHRLAGTVLDGRILPLLTLRNLIDFSNLQHYRWWVYVPRLGAVRAARLMDWLRPLAAELGHPVSEVALAPMRRRALARRNVLARLEAQGLQRYGVVPLDRLAVPPELDGRAGVFRTGRPNTFGVDTDLAAIYAWLRRHQDSPRTAVSYGRVVERFYLWCLWVRRTSMSSITEGDVLAYRAFLANPPAHWVQARRAARDSAEWRPFKGPLSPMSQRLDLTVIAALLSALVQGGYLAANAAAGVLPAMKLPAFTLHVERSFSDAQWAWVMRCWRALYAACGAQPMHGVETRAEVELRGDAASYLPEGSASTSMPEGNSPRAALLRRTRLVLELGATTGMRLIELVTTRRAGLARHVVDGHAVWILAVLGKGYKLREVLLLDDVKALLDQHHRDMVAAGTALDSRNARVRGLLDPRAQAGQASEGGRQSPLRPGAPPLSTLAQLDPSDLDPTPPAIGEVVDLEDPRFKTLPLIGALRRGPPQWETDQNGVAFIDRNAPGNADRHGSLDPTALCQAMKRFLRRCAAMAREQGADVDAAGLERASTHWLRHFFANSAAADNVMPVALMGAMGHASLQTTSVYLHAERRLIVSELGKMRRRS